MGVFFSWKKDSDNVFFKSWCSWYTWFGSHIWRFVRSWWEELKSSKPSRKCTKTIKDMGDGRSFLILQPYFYNWILPCEKMKFFHEFFFFFLWVMSFLEKRLDLLKMTFKKPEVRIRCWCSEERNICWILVDGDEVVQIYMALEIII